MDKALVFGTKDCRFESCQGHLSLCCMRPGVVARQHAAVAGAAKAPGSVKGVTPCGTRTRNLRIRSPTPCPLGQGGQWPIPEVRVLRIHGVPPTALCGSCTTARGLCHKNPPPKLLQRHGCTKRRAQRSSTPMSIARAWRELCKRAHPDLNQGPADLQSAALTTELCTQMPGLT